MALEAIDVSSKPPVAPPSPPRVDSWARGGRRSKRRAGSADGQHHHQSEEEYAALCLIMFSRGFRGGEDSGRAIKSAATAPANKASQAGYECSVCGKVYASYQALGGHKTSHRKPAPTPPPPLPSRAAASAGGDAPAAEEKVHQCSLCLRTFPSGQALGGHKRLHYEGGAAAADGVNKEQQLISKAKPSAAAAAVVLRDFDLNLPAAAATTAVAAMEEIEIAPPEAKRARMMLVAV